MGMFDSILDPPTKEEKPVPAPTAEPTTSPFAAIVDPPMSRGEAIPTIKEQFSGVASALKKDFQPIKGRKAGTVGRDEWLQAQRVLTLPLADYENEYFTQYGELPTMEELRTAKEIGYVKFEPGEVSTNVPHPPRAGETPYHRRELDPEKWERKPAVVNGRKVIAGALKNPEAPSVLTDVRGSWTGKTPLEERRQALKTEAEDGRPPETTISSGDTVVRRGVKAKLYRTWMGEGTEGGRPGAGASELAASSMGGGWEQEVQRAEARLKNEADQPGWYERNIGSADVGSTGQYAGGMGMDVKGVAGKAMRSKDVAIVRENLRRQEERQRHPETMLAKATGMAVEQIPFQTKFAGGPLAFVPGAIQAYQRRRTARVTGVDAAGNPEFDESGVQGAAEAAWKAATDQAWEYVSERSGRYLDMAGARLIEKSPALLRKPVQRIVEGLQFKGKAGDVVNRVFDRLGVASVPSEIGEELVNNVGKALTGSYDEYSGMDPNAAKQMRGMAGAEKIVFQAEHAIADWYSQIPVMAVSFGVSIGAPNLVAKIADIGTEKATPRQLSDEDKGVLRDTLNERWDRAQSELGTPGQYEARIFAQPWEINQEYEFLREQARNPDYERLGQVYGKILDATKEKTAERVADRKQYIDAFDATFQANSHLVDQGADPEMVVALAEATASGDLKGAQAIAEQIQKTLQPRVGVLRRGPVATGIPRVTAVMPETTAEEAIKAVTAEEPAKEPQKAEEKAPAAPEATISAPPATGTRPEPGSGQEVAKGAQTEAQTAGRPTGEAPGSYPGQAGPIPAPATKTPRIVEVRDTWGNRVFVDQNDVDSGRQQLRVYTQSGKRAYDKDDLEKTIHRENVIGIRKETPSGEGTDFDKRITERETLIKKLATGGWRLPATQPSGRTEGGEQKAWHDAWERGLRPYMADANGNPVEAWTEKDGKKTLKTTIPVWAKPAATKEPALAPEAKTAAKEPWQMTREEYARGAKVRRDMERNYVIITSPNGKEVITRTLEPGQPEEGLIEGAHRVEIAEAIREGKAVPPAVLAEYPDLKPEAPKTKADSEKKDVEHTVSLGEHRREENFQKWFHENLPALQIAFLDAKRAGYKGSLSDFGRAWRMPAERAKLIALVAANAPDNEPAAAPEPKTTSEWTHERIAQRMHELLSKADPNFPRATSEKSAKHVETAMATGVPGGLLYSANKNMRKLFTEITGVKLPSAQRDTATVFKQWFESKQEAPDAIRERGAAEVGAQPGGTEGAGDEGRAGVRPGEPGAAAAGARRGPEAGEEKQGPVAAEQGAGDVKIEKTPQGKTVSVPAKDKPGLPPKEQKKYLLAEIDKAIETAPADAPKGKVKIEVPDDGTFTVVNSKLALEAFKKVVQARFPTTTPKGSTRALSTAAPGIDRSADDALGIYGNATEAAKRIRAQVEAMAPTEDMDADKKNIERWLRVADELDSRSSIQTQPSLQNTEEIQRLRKRMAEGAAAAADSEYEKKRAAREQKALAALKAHPRYGELRGMIEANRAYFPGGIKDNPLPKDGDLLNDDPQGRGAPAIRELQDKIAEGIGLRRAKPPKNKYAPSRPEFILSSYYKDVAQEYEPAPEPEAAVPTETPAEPTAATALKEAAAALTKAAEAMSKPEEKPAPAFARTTPAPGTPERATMDAEYKAASDAYDAAIKAAADHREKKPSKTWGPGYDKWNKHDDMLQSSVHAAGEVYEATRKRNYLAMQEDALNNPRDEAQRLAVDASMAPQTDAGKELYRKNREAIAELAAQKSKELGATESEAKDVGRKYAGDIMQYPLSDTYAFNKYVDVSLHRVRYDEWMGELRETISNMDLENERGRFELKLSNMSIWTTPEDRDALLEEAKKVDKANRAAQVRKDAAYKKEQDDKQAAELAKARELKAAGKLLWIRLGEKGNEWKAVEADPVQLHGVSWGKFWIRKIPATGSTKAHWSITDEASGMQIGEGESKPMTVIKASTKLKAIGREKYEGLVAKAMENAPPKPDITENTGSPAAANKPEAIKGGRKEKKFYRGVMNNGEGAGTFSMGKGLYSSPNRQWLTDSFKFDRVIELTADEAYPTNPLVLRDPTEFMDWALRESGEPNARRFNEKYPDPGVFVRSKGFDGVVAGDEIVKYSESTPAPAQPETAPGTEAGAEASRTIDDFGKKLGGARKDKVASVEKEISDDELGNLTLSEIWPKSEVDAIEEPDMAALATALRDEVPAKPRKGYKLARWVESVKLVRTLMKYANEHGYDATMKRMVEFSRTLEGFADKVNLLRQSPREHWGRIGKVHNYPDAYSYADAKEGEEGAIHNFAEKWYKKIPHPHATAYVDGRTVTASSLAELPAAVNERLGVPAENAAMQFEVRGRTTSKDGIGRWIIVKKGDPLYRPLKTFEGAQSKEALAFVKNNRADLVAAWEAVKESDNVKETDVRRADNRPRTGADWRKGKDATPQMFLDAFGFRGVEFGNWVSQGSNAKERQGMLNQAFDALHDLADILKVPPKALSLNGTLGLGMGSRGHGWASAHYEPDTIVINLTKTRGAGSLAHELFHAFDHYFQRQRPGDKRITEDGAEMMTFQPEGYYENSKTGHRLSASRFAEIKARGRFDNEADWKRIEGVRPEVEQAFVDLVTALDASPMAKRSALIDKGKSGGYWSRIIERAARAFENYVIAKMQQKGYQNDYLANVVKMEEFNREPGRYPYLRDEELTPVAEAFDNLFSTIKTRETPEGVAMFSLSGAGAPRAEIDLTDVAATVGGYLGGDLPVTVVASDADLPAGIRAEARGKGVAGAYSGGRIYLVRSNIQGTEHAIRVVLEEAAHMGLRKAGVLIEIVNSAYGQKGKYAVLRSQIMAEYGYRADDPRLTEEIIAHVAQEGQKAPGLWKRLVAAVARVFRQLGLFKTLTDAEVEVLAARALQASVERKGTGDRLVADNATITPPGGARMMVQAYHGTPHTFEPEPGAPLGKVKKEKVGTGEGAAAYGWGVLYTAQKRDVAENYRDQLARDRAQVRVDGKPVDIDQRSPLAQALLELPDIPSDPSRITVEHINALANVRQAINEGIRFYDEQEDHSPDAVEYMKVKRAFDADPRRVTADRGNLYHVELAFDPEDCLDWDRPLSEQSDNVRKAVVDRLSVLKNNEPAYSDERWIVSLDQTADQSINAYPTKTAAIDAIRNMTGGDLYRSIEPPKGGRQTSEYLASLGIKGIRYADQGSRHFIPEFDRGVGKWNVKNNQGGEQWFDSKAEAQAFSDTMPQKTYNYVVFNESDIRVVGRNGEMLSPTEAMSEQAGGTGEARMALAGKLRKAPELSPEQQAVFNDLLKKLEARAAARVAKAGPAETAAEREGSIHTAAKQPTAGGQTGIVTTAARIGRREGDVVAREAMISKAMKRYEERTGEPWPYKRPTNIRPVVTAAVEAGVAEEKEKGRLMSAEYSVDKAFRLMAAERGVREIDWLRQAGRQVKQMDAAMATMTEDQKNAFITAQLSSMLGSHFNAVLRSNKYFMPTVLKSVRAEIQDRLFRRYGRSILKTYERFRQQGNAPNKWMVMLAPEAKAAMQAWLTKVQGGLDANGDVKSQDYTWREERWQEKAEIMAADRNAKYVFLQGRRIAIAEAANDVADEVRGLRKTRSMLRPTPEGRALTGRPAGVYKWLFFNPQNMVRSWVHGVKSSRTYQVLVAAVMRGQLQSAVARHQIKRELNAYLKAHGWTHGKVFQLQKTPIAVEGPDGQKQSMTKGEIMELYARSMMKENALEMDKEGIRFRSGRVHGNADYDIVMPKAGMGKAWVDGLAAKHLTADERALTEKVFALMSGPRITKAINRASLALSGHEKAIYTGGYWPNIRDYVRQDQALDKEMESEQFRAGSLKRMGFLKTRSDNVEPLRIGNIMDVFNEHIHDAFHFAYLAVPIDQALRVLQSTAKDHSNVQATITARTGTRAVRDLKQWYADLSGLTNPRPHWFITRVFGGLINNVSKTKLAFRVTSWLRNRTGMVPYITMLAEEGDWVGVAKLVGTLATPMLPKTYWALPANRRDIEYLSKDGILGDRWDEDNLIRVFVQAQETRGFLKEITDSRARMLLQLGKLKYDEAMEWGLSWMSDAEKVSAVQLYRHFVSKGLTASQARDKVSKWTTQTQNPSTSSEETALYREARDNPLIRATIPFMGQPTVMTNWAVDAWYNLQEAKAAGDKAAIWRERYRVWVRMLGAATTAASSAAIGYAMLSLRVRGDPDRDEDDDRKRALDALYNAGTEFMDYFAPGLGRIAEMQPFTLVRNDDDMVRLGLNSWKLTKTHNMASAELVRAIESGFKAHKNWVDEDDERMTAYLNRFIQASGSVMGVPLDSAANIYETIVGQRTTTLPKD